MLSFSNSALPTCPGRLRAGAFSAVRRDTRCETTSARSRAGHPGLARGAAPLWSPHRSDRGRDVARMKRELESGSGGGQQRPMDRQSYVLCHQGRGRSLSAGSQVTLEGGAENPRRRIRSTRQLPRGQWPGAVNRGRKLNVRFGVQSGNQPGSAYAPSEVTDRHKTRGWDSISSRAFALADQACGCEHDSRDECS